MIDVKQIDVKSTLVCGVQALRLSELKARACTLEELQSSVVQLIEIVNANQAELNKILQKLQTKQWQASI